MDILCELGRRITQCTDDHRKSAFLFQRLSILIQRYNVVTVFGTFTHPPLRGWNVAIPAFVPVFSLVFSWVFSPLFYQGAIYFIEKHKKCTKWLLLCSANKRSWLWQPTEACHNHGTKISDVVAFAECSYATSDPILQRQSFRFVTADTLQGFQNSTSYTTPSNFNKKLTTEENQYQEILYTCIAKQKCAGNKKYMKTKLTSKHLNPTYTHEQKQGQLAEI